MYINWELFRQLYRDAQGQADFEYYVADRGWQEWMDACGDADEIQIILRRVYDIARLDFAGLRALLGVSQAEMALAYNIPLRTYESWEIGERTPAHYILPLIAYTVFSAQLQANAGEE